MRNKFAIRMAGLVFCISGAFACQAQQGGTPFIPPPPVPAHGQPFHKDDPAYPKFLAIYDQIQVNFGSAAGMQPAAAAIAELQKNYQSSPYPLLALAEYKYALVGQNPRGNSEVMAILEHVRRTNGADIPDAYILEAKIDADRHDARDALEEANVAVRFAPDKPESQFALARAQDISGNLQAAEVAYLKFISLVGDAHRKANGYAWLAESLSSTELPRATLIANQAKAADALRMSAQLAPNYSHVMRYAAYLVTDIGDTSKATEQLGKILAQNPSDDDVRFYMGLVEYLKWARANPKGEHAAALDDIRRQWGVSKDDAFITSALYYALEPVASAMLNDHAVKNINAVCSDACISFPPGASAIINASFADNAELAKRLAEHGANVNTQGDRNRTPLMYALMNEDAELAAYLLGKGARINVAASDGMTPLEIAVAHPASAKKTVALLLKYHADPLGVASNGVPIVVAAVRRNNPDAFELLLDVGKVDVNLKDSHGYPLLYFAMDHPDMVRLLLAKGADPWITTSDGDLLAWRAAFPPESSAMVDDARRNRPKK